MTQTRTATLIDLLKTADLAQYLPKPFDRRLVFAQSFLPTYILILPTNTTGQYQIEGIGWARKDNIGKRQQAKIVEVLSKIRNLPGVEVVQNGTYSLCVRLKG